jgi:hypothetical protein
MDTSGVAMPVYRIFRMKDHERQRFRWAPHTSGATMVKPRDFEEQGTVEAASVYTAWSALKESEKSLDIGDILIAPNDEMRILKYVGFEEARWIIPEVKTGIENVPPASGPAPVALESPAH